MLATKGGLCEIFKTDQGAQFTTPRFTQPLLDHSIQISMDGRGRALDNIFVERLWRTVKYEHVYLQEIQTVQDARSGLKQYFEFYNHERLRRCIWRVQTHQSSMRFTNPPLS